VQSQWSERFSTMAGVRRDQYSDYGGTVNTRLGAVWHPRPLHYFKMLYGEAFRVPSPEESLGFFGSFDGTTDLSGNYIGAGFRIPNTNLKPEKAKTLSLTWEWRPRPELNLMANAYHSRIDNLIVTQPSTATIAVICCANTSRQFCGV
jgi:outer membrane receptor protein involved in Fe transport